MKKNKKNILKFMKLDIVTILVVLAVLLILYLLDFNYKTKFISNYAISISISIFLIQSFDLTMKYNIYLKNHYTVEISTKKSLISIPFNKMNKLINAEIPYKRYRQYESITIFTLFFFGMILFYIIVIAAFYNKLEGVLDTILGHIFIALIINIIISMLQLWLARFLREGSTYYYFPVNFDSQGKIINKYKGTFKANHDKVMLSELQYRDYSETDLERELIYLNSLNIKYEKDHIIQHSMSILLAIIAGTLPLINSILYNMNIIEVDFKSIILYYIALFTTIGSIIIIGYKLINYFKILSKEDIYIKIKIIERISNKTISK